MAQKQRPCLVGRPQWAHRVYRLGYMRGRYAGEQGGKVKALERMVSKLRLEIEQVKTKQHFGF